MPTTTTPTPIAATAPTVEARPGTADHPRRRPAVLAGLALVVALLVGLVGTPAASAATPTFSDVGPGHPFLEEIEWMVEEGMTTGYQDGTFRPGEPVTRQAFAAFLHRAGQRDPRSPQDRVEPPPFVPPTTPTFPDVPVGHPFFTEIEWMAAMDLTTGYQDGTFRPAATISRQALAAFLHRGYQEMQAIEVRALVRAGLTPTFSDVGPGHPFLEAIEWMAEAGISTGYQDGTFRPADPVTRQATAAFLHRFDQLMVRPRD